MFTRLQKYQLRIIETGFFYLPTFPIHFNSEKRESCRINSKVSPFFITITVVNLMFATAGIFFMTPYYIYGLSSEKSINAARILIQIACLLFFTVAAILLTFSTKSQETVSGLNQLYFVKEKLDAGISKHIGI